MEGKSMIIPFEAWISLCLSMQCDTQHTVLWLPHHGAETDDTSVLTPLSWLFHCNSYYSTARRLVSSFLHASSITLCCITKMQSTKEEWRTGDQRWKATHAILDSWTWSFEVAHFICYCPARPAKKHIVAGSLTNMPNKRKDACRRVQRTRSLSGEAKAKLFTALSCSTCGIILGFALCDPFARSSFIVKPCALKKKKNAGLQWRRSPTSGTWDAGLRPAEHWSSHTQTPSKLTQERGKGTRNWSHLATTICSACT